MKHASYIVGLIFSLLLCHTWAYANVLSQVVIKFDSKRDYTYRYDKNDSSLILEIKNSSPHDLDALENYDERLIRRVLIKDLGVDGVIAKIILRGRNVKATINDFSEPFRITIDLFDANYTEKKDPKTGLPLDIAINSEDRKAPSYESNQQLQLQAPHQTTGSLFAKSESPKTLKLLQPTPELFQSEGEFTNRLSEVAAGVGSHWKNYPNYIYRIQTASFEGEAIRESTRTDQVKALSSARAMADYAGNLYNFGHENRALIAYQQVLHKDPTIFEKDALHLWKFSEIHLGQGNLTLANGYFETILDKHPESPLAEFAKLRILDIKAIRLVQQQKYKSTNRLTKNLLKIDSSRFLELSALAAIRTAYWSDNNNSDSYNADYLPKVDKQTYNTLSRSFENIESKKTKFFATSIMLNGLLDNSRPWASSTGKFASDYFNKFKNGYNPTYVKYLRGKLLNKINKTLQSQIASGKLINAIENYSQLPPTLKTASSNSKTSWALAEAYRKLGQISKSIQFYEMAQRGEEQGPNKFKSQFWLAVTSADHAAELESQNAGRSQIDSLLQKSRKADREMSATWSSLKETEKNQLKIAYKAHFEKVVTTGLKLRMPAKITLESWSNALATPASTSNGGETNDWQRHYSPTGSAVILLSDLAKRFSELGMLNERRKTRNLLKFMQPSQFKDDKTAKSIWANELLSLAEDYRNANQSLEAGRLFTLVGTKNPNWEGRAKSLYQGGLLLLRSGRKQEALQALQEASNDGNNLYYSDLAKERLNQIK